MDKDRNRDRVTGNSDRVTEGQGQTRQGQRDRYKEEGDG